MQVLVPIDIEDALQAALNAMGVNASAPPVPANIEDRLPHVMPWQVGGWRSSLVQDTFEVGFYARAESHGEAAELAATVCGIVSDLKGRTLGGVQCYGGEVTREPYPDPDPDHPELPRYTLTAMIVCRALPKELPDWPEDAQP